jgi:hypothetical protein
MHPMWPVLPRHQDSADCGGSDRLAQSRSRSANLVRSVPLAGGVGQRTASLAFQATILRRHERFATRARRRAARGRCGIYQDRPLVCRIYPAEINPLIELKADNKACPPEAWAQEQPLLYRGGKSMDEVMAQDIRSARESGARDAEYKRRLCFALNVVDTALVHEAVLVFSPAAKTLLSALTNAAAVHSPQEPERQLRFVSDQPDTLANLTQSGATALHPRDAAPAAFQLLGSKREPLFGI